MSSSLPLSRTALITGASRGLGRALADALAARGWKLIIDARDASTLEKAHSDLAMHTRVAAIAGDISDSLHRRELVRVAREWGGVDVVINNASVLGPSPQPTLLQYPLQELAKVYLVNVISPLALLQEVFPLLKQRGCVINVTSDAAIEPYEGWGGYGSSKAAFEQLSHILAAEQPQFRVYWVDPGDMRTDLHQQAFPGEDISDRPLPEVSVPGFLALINGDYPSGRYKARSVPSSSLDQGPDSEGNLTNESGVSERTTGDMRTQMHQEAFPGEDISDRPLPETSVPGLMTLPTGDLPSGRYQARQIGDNVDSVTGQPERGVRELRVALTVEDFDTALQLYRDGFGLETVKEWNTLEGRGMVLAAGRGTIELLDHADAEYTDAVEAGRRVSGPVRLALEVANVEAAAAKLTENGATPVHAPVMTSWGNPSQRLQAPDGLQLTLFQLPPTEES